MRSQPSINALRRQNLIVINLKIKEEMRKVLTTKNTTIKEFLAQFSTVDQERVLKFVAIIGITELYRERKDATGKEKRSFTLGEVRAAAKEREKRDQARGLNDELTQIRGEILKLNQKFEENFRRVPSMLNTTEGKETVSRAELSASVVDERPEVNRKLADKEFANAAVTSLQVTSSSQNPPTPQLFLSPVQRRLGLTPKVTETLPPKPARSDSSRRRAPHLDDKQVRETLKDDYLCERRPARPAKPPIQKTTRAEESEEHHQSITPKMETKVTSTRRSTGKENSSRRSNMSKAKVSRPTQSSVAESPLPESLRHVTSRIKEQVDADRHSGFKKKREPLVETSPAMPEDVQSPTFNFQGRTAPWMESCERMPLQEDKFVLLLKDERGQKTSTRIVAEPPRAVHRAEVEEPRKTRLPSTVTDRGAWVSGIEASGGRCLGDPRESSASRNNLLEIADSFLNSPLMQHLQNMSMTAPQARDSGNLVRATTILPDTYGGAFPPPKTPGGISLGKAPSPNDRYSKASCDFMEYMRMIGGQAQGRRRDYSNLLTRTGNPEDNMSSTSSNFSVLSFDDDIRGFLQHQFRMKHQIPGSSEQMPDSDAEMPLAPRDSRLPGANELRSSEDMDESSSQLSVQLASGQIPKQAMNLFFTTWDNGNVNN
eukprot:TRINITY_DN1378_c0_g2_i2.p1 TRINITY_DN1378_c0_g2~~TRINITY_DN1378_c0_g2_i2.p1  ORF type:complete len:657 (-),score=137.51 TRINITY_DN1378_c0_g2_i2:30-2000(-)